MVQNRIKKSGSSKLCIHITNIICIVIYFVIYSGYLKILFPIFNNFFSIIQIVSIAFGSVMIIAYRKKIKYYKIYIKPMMLMINSFVLMALAIFKTVNYQSAISKIISMIITIVFMLFIFFISEFVCSEKEVEKLIDIIIKLNLFFLGMYITLNINNIIELIYAGIRGGSFESNPIWIARVCGDTLVLVLIKYYRRMYTKNILEIILLFALSFFMGSKGPLVAVFISIFLFYLFYNNKKIGKFVWSFLSGIILLLVLFLIMENSQSNFIQNRFSLESIVNPEPGYRVNRYMYSLAEIPKHIISGHGLGNWTIDYWKQVKYIPRWMTLTMLQSDYPHNIILEILYECGIIALIPIIFAVITLIKITPLKLLNRNYVSIYVLLITNFGYSMFSGSITEGNRGIYYFLALHCGLINACALRNRLDRGKYET